MYELCDLCGNSGALRDGGPCPRCSMSQWTNHDGQETVRLKRTTWIRFSERHIQPREKTMFVRLVEE